MRSLSLAVCGLLLAGPGFAQSPNWLNARTIEIDMKNFAFVPATITLQRGVPYRLRCGSAWKKDPGSGVIGVEKGPLIPVV